MSDSESGAHHRADSDARTIKAFEIVIGILVTIALALGGWALGEIFALSKDEAANHADASAKLEAMQKTLDELKTGPTRNEWNTLQLQIGEMNNKLDRILQQRTR